MFKIENDTFHVTWGDRGSFDLTFKDYTFEVDDRIRINIYEEDGMDEEPILSKEVQVTESADVVSIELLGGDTQLGEPSNERRTYWYEITLNGDQTPFCFDQRGPKLFYIYPGGVDTDGGNS